MKNLGCPIQAVYSVVRSDLADVFFKRVVVTASPTSAACGLHDYCGEISVAELFVVWRKFCCFRVWPRAPKKPQGHTEHSVSCHEVRVPHISLVFREIWVYRGT